jgi:hypothetical protein
MLQYTHITARRVRMQQHSSELPSSDLTLTVLSQAIRTPDYASQGGWNGIAFGKGCGHSLWAETATAERAKRATRILKAAMSTARGKLQRSRADTRSDHDKQQQGPASGGQRETGSGALGQRKHLPTCSDCAAYLLAGAATTSPQFRRREPKGCAEVPHSP